jgi:hypothetical protein
MLDHDGPPDLPTSWPLDALALLPRLIRFLIKFHCRHFRSRFFERSGECRNFLPSVRELEANKFSINTANGVDSCRSYRHMPARSAEYGRFGRYPATLFVENESRVSTGR